MDTDILIVEDSTNAGAVVWWRLGGEVDYKNFEKAHENDFKDIVCPPSLPTPLIALRRTAFSLQRKDLLARQMKNKNWALVNEFTNESGLLQYTVNAILSLNQANDSLVVEGMDTKLEETATRIFERHQTNYDSMDISMWISNLVNILSGMPLRDRGGIYFIPQYSLDSWLRVTKSLSNISSHSFFTIPAMRTEEAVAAILDAVERHAEYTIEKIEKEAETLGNRALSNRKLVLETTEKELARYEKLLDVKLPNLRHKIEETKCLISTALLSEIKDD